MSKYEKKIQEIVEASRSHMTAEQVFDALRQVYPKVVRATVYNNLNRLWETGRIRKLSMEGSPDRYDRIARHDHLVCKGCGKLLDLDLTDLFIFRHLDKFVIPYFLYPPFCHPGHEQEIKQKQDDENDHIIIDQRFSRFFYFLHIFILLNLSFS